jgi:hypothetical protein
MEHFKRFEDDCALYDFVMKRWFTFFTDDDPRVCYVKYDSLVTNFQHETGRVIEFLNLQWDDGILNFAENAKQRSASTPSYAKVRQGLCIGVQSSWRKYDFLFDGTNKKHLDFWVKKFGYDVT